MSLIPERSRLLFDAFPNSESLTVVAVTGTSIKRAAAALLVDLDAPRDLDRWDEHETAWALREIPGGVVAIEGGGFGDPTTAAMRTLSEGGRTAAVVRNNILAHVRFGCARDGQLLFDDDEFRYHVDDPTEVPEELRPLIREADSELWFLVGLAMVELFTGLEINTSDVAGLYESRFYLAPNLVYRQDE